VSYQIVWFWVGQVIDEGGKCAAYFVRRCCYEMVPLALNVTGFAWLWLGNWCMECRMYYCI